MNDLAFDDYVVDYDALYFSIGLEVDVESSWFGSTVGLREW
jgi:hypothetical protein